MEFIRTYKRILASLILVVFGFVSKYSYSQFVDPATQSQLTILNSTQATSLSSQIEQAGMFSQMLNIQQKLKKAKEAYDWAKALKMVVRIEKLIEKMYCQIKEMKFYVGIAGDLGCFADVKFEQTLLSYQTSMDFLAIAVGTGALAMSAEGRIKTLSDAIDKLEKAISQIHSFNVNQRLNINNTFRSYQANQIIKPLMIY